jgi:molecular chaperone DnaK
MGRATIDFGIDLGTTNSAIAVLKGMNVEIIRNNEGHEYTPSVVWIDKKNRMFVGAPAKERVESDPENAAHEFKLKMGTDEEFTFTESGVKMKPHELSSQVLLALKSDVQRSLGEVVENAVITVPAGFEQPQCEATNEAAMLAGFTLHPLLQEPVAAAQAYGFQTERDRVFWMVFDFGGGTFDAAIIHVRDGVIQVVNHEGDNHLGGKLLDWAIVEDILVPALEKERSLTDFRRGTRKWIQAFAKLKHHAEIAKIRLSRDDSAPIRIDFLCNDDKGRPVEFDFELYRKDVERLAEPFIKRAINLSKKALEKSRLSPGDIEQVLLVGGPTNMPYLREQLADSKEGLGIKFEFSVDPLTVVARGAAIVAGTQRVGGEIARPTAVGEYALEIEYKPMGPDPEPLVGGKVVAREGDDLSGFTIEFVNTASKPAWRSGKLGLAPKGAFMATLWAEKGVQNVFEIELSDPNGVRQKVTPNSITYIVGNQPVEDPMLIHSIGVALANNEMEWFLEKGSSLPQRKRVILRTVFDVRQGFEGDVIRIPVMEGENRRADRNRRIGTLEIHEKQVKRNVPAGTEVEVTINMDRSRLLTVRAYIPILDEEYEDVINRKEYGHHNLEVLEKETQREKDRLSELREKVGETEDENAKEILGRIDGERMVHDVDVSLEAAELDQEAADKCDKRLLDLKVALDQIEDALEWPSLVKEAEGLISSGRNIADEYGESKHRTELKRYEEQVRSAIKTHDPDLLRQRMDELRSFVLRILDEKGILQVLYFQKLCEEQASMRDQRQAEHLIAQGHRCINDNDYQGLKDINRQLAALLPSPPAQPDLSTVTR